RALASEGDLRQGSNQGKGQIKTADYVLVPDLVSKNSNAGGFNAGALLGGFFGWSGFGASGASGSAATEIGQVITLAYLDAYTKLIAQLGALPDNASEANVQQAVTMNKPGHMYMSPSPKSKVVRTLDPGMMLYPTGNKDGVWWE